MLVKNRFYVKEIMIKRSINIDSNLYEGLIYMSENVVDASVNELLNFAIDNLIREKKIEIYAIDKDADIVCRTFKIKKSFYDEMQSLKDEYGIPFYRLVNIAIRQMLIRENMLER